MQLPPWAPCIHGMYAVGTQKQPANVLCPIWMHHTPDTAGCSNTSAAACHCSHSQGLAITMVCSSKHCSIFARPCRVSPPSWSLGVLGGRFCSSPFLLVQVGQVGRRAQRRLALIHTHLSWLPDGTKVRAGAKLAKDRVLKAGGNFQTDLQGPVVQVYMSLYTKADE